MSEIDAALVKRGKWTNLSQGKIMGQTITTDVQTGTLVIALLAVFTSLGLTHLFHLCTFFYHQFRANGRPADALFRQQQVLLRTLPGPSSLATGSIKLWLSWKNVADKALSRTLLQALVAASFALASVVASIFSSSVVTSTNLEVLVESPFCALIDMQASESSQRLYASTVRSLAIAYADDCYTNQTSIPVRCKAFIQPRIPLKVTTEPCPFTADFCVSPALAIDSGLLDLGKDFGLNLAPEDRVRYRKRTTAVVLSLDGRVELLNASTVPTSLLGRDALPGETLVSYGFGQRSDATTLANSTFATSLITANITYSYSMTQMQYFMSTDISSYYDPLPQLRSMDADILVRLLAKGAVKYLEPVHDPMFAAHQVTHVFTNADNKTHAMYLSDTPGTVVAFMEQYQYCITNSSSNEVCSELSGWPGFNLNQSFPGASDIQVSILNVLQTIDLFFSTDLNRQVKASERLGSGGVNQLLPEGQWETELIAWESNVWAMHQIAIADYAIGPAWREPSEAGLTRNASTPGEKKLCGMQKMRKAGDFININYFGLVFIIAVSTVVTILDIFILRFLVFLKSSRQFWTPRVNRWLQDGVWQLQRRAYEAHGEGDWIKLNDEVPTTDHNILLHDLPIETLSKSLGSLHQGKHEPQPDTERIPSSNSLEPQLQSPTTEHFMAQENRAPDLDGQQLLGRLNSVRSQESLKPSPTTERESDSESDPNQPVRDP